MSDRKLVDIFQRDRAGRAGLLAVATEDAAQQVHIEDTGIALAGRDALLLGVLLRLDIDRIGGTRPSAEEAADAALQAILITVEHMASAEALRQFRVVPLDMKPSSASCPAP